MLTLFPKSGKPGIQRDKCQQQLIEQKHTNFRTAICHRRASSAHIFLKAVPGGCHDNFVCPAEIPIINYYAPLSLIQKLDFGYPGKHARLSAAFKMGLFLKINQWYRLVTQN